MGMLHGTFSAHAEGLVCGDGAIDPGEQCDDGGTSNGDGCSSTCGKEICGNAVKNIAEQCDDGNIRNNDGCDQSCQLEFCGNKVIESPRGEVCDDGNGISGDGCSSACALEKKTLEHPAAPPEPPPSAPSTLTLLAQQAKKFLQTKTGEIYKTYLAVEGSLQIDKIVDMLASGRRLSTLERGWTKGLYEKLEKARVAEQERYIAALQQFISTPISIEFAKEKGLDLLRLAQSVPAAIEELKRAGVTILPRPELIRRLELAMAKLRRQGIKIEEDMSEGFAGNLKPDTDPFIMFLTIKALKEATEKYATQDLQGSLEALRGSVSVLRENMSLLKDIYDLHPVELEPLLYDIDTISEEMTPQELERIIGAVNRLLGLLDRRGIFTQADVATLALEQKHAAATVDRLARQSGTSAKTPEEQAAFVKALAEKASEEAKIAFTQGTPEEQRPFILAQLQSPRALSLREILREEGRTDFEEKYAILKTAIDHAGDDVDKGNGCDDSMADALRCTNEYLRDLETAFRHRNWRANFIGTLQDFFGIGS